MTGTNARTLPATTKTVPTVLSVLRDEERTEDGGHRKRRLMDSDNYPPEGGMTYKDFHSANASFRRMYQGETRAWVVSESVAFAEREKTADKCEKIFPQSNA